MIWKKRVGKDGYLYLPPDVFDVGDRVLIERGKKGVLILRKIEDDMIIREVVTRRRIFVGDLIEKNDVIIEKIGDGVFIVREN